MESRQFALLLVLLTSSSSACADVSPHQLDISPPRPGTCVNNRTLHLIRHAEGHHNIDEVVAEQEKLYLKSSEHTKLREEFGIAWMLLERVSARKYHDPLLTPKGREQAYQLRSKLRNEESFHVDACLLYTSPSPRDRQKSRMPSSA